jgi:hypothetical protein
MPKRKPDTVTRLEFAFNRADRKMIEEYLLFQKADKVSETISQVGAFLFGSETGLIGTYILIDMIDRSTMPREGFTAKLSSMASHAFGQEGTDKFDWGKFLFSMAPFTQYERIGDYIEYRQMTEAQKQEATPIRYGVSTWCKRIKTIILAYFIMQHGDDWIQAIGQTFESLSGGGGAAAAALL